jgi:hypothetical protein
VDGTLVQKRDATISNNSYARKAVQAALAAKPAGTVATIRKFSIYISRPSADCTGLEIAAWRLKSM